jgi:4-hydroxy-2-oxoheptanedioate aldolase
VDSCRYPPRGTRGSGPVRASVYFNHYEEYMKNADAETLLVVQIETMQTLPQLDEILGVDGIDAIFVGPSDLELSMNHLENGARRPSVEEVILQIFEKAKRAGVPYGTLTANPEEFQKFARAGATLLTVGGDLGFLLEGALACQRQTLALLGSDDMRVGARV